MANFNNMLTRYKKHIVGCTITICLLIFSSRRTAPTTGVNEDALATKTSSVDTDVKPSCPPLPPPSSNSTETAYHESLQFFDDITTSQWSRLKAKVEEMGSNYNDNLIGEEFLTATYYQNHFEPNFVCRHAMRIGGSGIDGRWVCDPHRIEKQKSCLIYSFGPNDDMNHEFLFQKAIKNDVASHCEIHLFDYAAYTIFSDDLPKGITHHVQKPPGSSETTTSRYKSLGETMKLLGHDDDKKMIDILHIDCPYCNSRHYEALLFADDDNIPARQILLTMNHDNYISSMNGISYYEQEQTTNPVTTFFEKLVAKGYVIFHKEPILQTWAKYDHWNMEYGFLKLDKSFFNFEAQG